MRNQTAGIVRERQSLFCLTLNTTNMKIKIKFEDVNHVHIATHIIEYNSITPPYFAVIKYCETIKYEYPDVFFYYIE